MIENGGSKQCVSLIEMIDRTEGFRPQLLTLMLWLAILLGTKVFMANNVKASPADGEPGGLCKSGNTCDDSTITVCENNTCKYTNGTSCTEDSMCVDGAKCVGWGCTKKVCVCETERTPVDLKGQCAASLPEGEVGGPCISWTICNDNDSLCDDGFCKYKQNTSCLDERHCVSGAKCKSTTKICTCEIWAYEGGRCSVPRTYSAELTAVVLKTNETMTYNLSCTFQDGIPMVNSVYFRRETCLPTCGHANEKLLEASCDVDEGKAKLVKLLEGTKLESFSGSLKDRSIKLAFSNISKVHSGYYWCVVSYKDSTTADIEELKGDFGSEYDHYLVEITYTSKKLIVNNKPVIEMEIVCAFEDKLPFLYSAEVNRAAKNGSHTDDGTIVYANKFIFNGRASTGHYRRADNVTAKSPQGSLQQHFISSLVYFISKEAREYECTVEYGVTDGGQSTGRRYIELEQKGIRSPIKSSSTSLVDEHGRPTIRDAAVLLCSVIGLFVVRMCT